MRQCHQQTNISEFITSKIDTLKLENKPYIQNKIKILSQIKQTNDLTLIQEVPRWPLYIHVVSVVIVLTFSATYHCVLCTSKDNLILFRRLDFTGIILATAGQCTAPFYYGFYCQEM